MKVAFGVDLVDPAKTALAYGLAILRRDVHDNPDNATGFVVLARGIR
jgi:prephenate dehydratase